MQCSVIILKFFILSKYQTLLNCSRSHCPQFVALKNEDPQNQLCIKFKTLMTPSKIGRTQIFAR